MCSRWNRGESNIAGFRSETATRMELRAAAGEAGSRAVAAMAAAKVQIDNLKITRTAPFEGGRSGYQLGPSRNVASLRRAGERVQARPAGSRLAVAGIDLDQIGRGRGERRPDR